MYRFFLQHFFRNPKNVGAVAPLSQSVAHQLLKDLSQRQDNKPWRILEAGAGTGSVTKEILQLMHENDTLDIVEIDEECCKLLTERFKNEPRAQVHCLSVLDWSPSYSYDFIVSTLPMNSFSSKFVENILNHYQQISTDNAHCTYVEYIGLETLSLVFAKNEKRKTITGRRQLLSDFHKTHLIEKSKVFANFLPCYVYHMTLHKSAT